VIIDTLKKLNNEESFIDVFSNTDTNLIDVMLNIILKEQYKINDEVYKRVYEECQIWI
jgi:hypothetical protein